MASFTLRAYPASKNRDHGATIITSRPFESVGAPQRIEARNITEIAAAVAGFGKRIRAEHPDASFSIGVTIGRGDRKPNGFDKANLRNGFGQDNWIEERDRDGNRVVPGPAVPAAAAA